MQQAAFNHRLSSQAVVTEVISPAPRVVGGAGDTMDYSSELELESQLHRRGVVRSPLSALRTVPWALSPILLGPCGPPAPRHPPRSPGSVCCCLASSPAPCPCLSFPSPETLGLLALSQRGPPCCGPLASSHLMHSCAGRRCWDWPLLARQTPPPPFPSAVGP